MQEIKGQIFLGDEKKAKEEVEWTLNRVEPGVDFLAETQQRVAAAYTAYIEAQHQLEEAYKKQEQQVEKAYNEAVEQARKACEESLAQCKKVYEESVALALRTRDEAEQTARKTHNEAMERIWAVFTKARK